MSLVAERLDRQSTQMPVVRFKTETLEDIAKTRREGVPVFKDVDFALITSPGTKDVHIEEIPEYWDKLKQDVSNGRLSEEWVRKQKERYEAYKKNQELPVDGTPIKGWNVIAPAVQENLIARSIVTVEDLARIGDEAMRGIGMGALELKTRAKSWLEQMTDKAGLTVKMSTLTTENAALKMELETIKSQVEQLKQLIPNVRPELSGTEPEAAKRGKPRKEE